MQHTVTWFDRLRIERVVWALDQRLYDLPRRTRIETRREVRQNLLTGARDVGTTQALRNLGGSAELAQEYLSAAFGSRPRHSWMAAGLFFAHRSLPRPVVVHRRSERLRQRDHRRRPRRHRHVHLGWHLASAEHRHLHVQRRPRNVDRRRLHTSLLHPLDRGDDPRRATLASASGLAKASRRSCVNLQRVSLLDPTAVLAEPARRSTRARLGRAGRRPRRAAPRDPACRSPRRKHGSRARRDTSAAPRA